jgi:hypothetical protein
MSGVTVMQRMTVAEYLVVNQPRPLHQRVMVDLLVALTNWSLAQTVAAR